MDNQSFSELQRLNEELGGIASRLDIVERLEVVRSSVNNHKTAPVWASRRELDKLDETVDDLKDAFKLLSTKLDLLQRAIEELCLEA